jgi:hypothetical protein
MIPQVMLETVPGQAGLGRLLMGCGPLDDSLFFFCFFQFLFNFEYVS